VYDHAPSGFGTLCDGAHGLNVHLPKQRRGPGVFGVKWGVRAGSEDDK
jgi:hypothetical protein